MGRAWKWAELEQKWAEVVFGPNSLDTERSYYDIFCFYSVVQSIHPFEKQQHSDSSANSNTFSSRKHFSYVYQWLQIMSQRTNMWILSYLISAVPKTYMYVFRKAVEYIHIILFLSVLLDLGVVLSLHCTSFRRHTMHIHSPGRPSTDTRYWRR